MAQLFAPPYQNALDTNGVPISGGKLYFYASGGLTPASVYTTSARNVAHASPVVADSAGRYPAIYLDPNTAYRVREFTAADVLIRDTDPITQVAAEDLSITASGSGGVARSLDEKLGDAVSANDYSTLQAAIAAAIATESPLSLVPGASYTISAGLSITGPLVLEGNGATINCSTAGIAIIAMSQPAGGTIIRNLNIVGASATYSTGSYGIHALGTRNGAAVAPTFLDGLTLENVKIENVGHTAFRLEYVTNVHILNPNVSNVGYAGILTIAADRVEIVSPIIDGVSGETGSGELNAYGISFTTDVVSSDRTRDPVSRRCYARGGLIRNIPTWQALDTHGGDLCGFDGVEVYNCRRAVFITYANATAAKDCYARNILAVNAYPRTDTNSNATAKIAAAFSVTGLSGDKATGIVIENCHAKGYGDPITQLGAFDLQHTDAQVLQCSDKNSWMVGIRMNGGYTGVIDGHKTIDLTSYSGAPTTVARCIDLFTTGGDNTAVISRHQMVRNITQPVGVTDYSAVVRSLSATNTVKFITCDFSVSDNPTPLLSGGSVAYLLGNTVRKSTTADRPTAPPAGQLYFDTTLDADGKPIWWTGTTWVDATGATV